MEKKQIYIICLSVITVSVLIGVFMSWSFRNVAPENEWPNNITLIIEIVVGVVVAAIVFMVAKTNEIKIDEKITNVLNIVEEREKIQKEKERFAQGTLYETLEHIQRYISQILSEFTEYKRVHGTSARQKYTERITSCHSRIHKLIEENLNGSWIVSPDFLDIDVVEKLKTISSVFKTQPVFEENNYLVLQRLIQFQMDDLATKIGILKNGDSKFKKKSEDKHAPISVSIDRTVYPLDSIIHVRTKLNKIIEGEPIICEIFDSKKELIATQTIDPETYDNPGPVGSGIFQADFRIVGKIHQKYTVGVTYGSSCSMGSFEIDQRMPIVQSDKSVYMTGADMIITVIDPDADKDSEVVEYVGDREDSKLVIESYYGKIDGYRLRETGNSTGIFQGIVGILGVRRDGAVIPQEFNGRTIDRIQGTGIDDGFIAGARGDELTVKYASKSGNTKLTFAISNFGYIIELDKKVYQPSDKVLITIIAPDVNADPKKIGEIGQNPNYIVNVHTTCDRIEGYKLIETGLKTGIFTGEIQLERIKSDSESEGDGSTGGKLFCRDDDFIEVSFRMFDDEKFVAKALIRSNVAKNNNLERTS